jgi:alpha-amylase/alpha-mannosidase (GH57 family)
MPNYDFKILNDKEFEILANELLSQELQIRFEGFKPGKDGGIDGRYFSNNGKQVIFQCKHWARSGFANLVRSLKKDEQAKVVTINPERLLNCTEY